MAEFHARFLVRASEDARRIQGALHARDFAVLGDICHGLAGNAGMFGFADLGTLARSVEEAIDAGADEAGVRELAAELVERLQLLERGV